MILREMSTTYGRSPGGYLWAVLEPVLAIMLLSVVFALAFRAPSLGDSFVLFYATGYLPYMLWLDVSNKVAASVRFSRPLLSFRPVTFIDAILARFILNVLTHLVVSATVLIGIHIIYAPVGLFDGLQVLNAYAMAGALAMGAGTLNCYLFSAFPAYERLWQIATRPLFILSGVIFVFEDVPAAYQGYLWINPLFHVTGEMRAGIYPTYEAAFVSPAFVYSLSIALFLLGLAFLRQYSDEIIHK